MNLNLYKFNTATRSRVFQSAKQLFFAVLLAAPTLSSAQSGIGTTTPAATAVLELKATDKALLLTRVANTAAVSPAVNGMIIYDISSNCIKAYEEGAWSDCLSSFGGSAATLANDCNTNGFAGTYTQNTAFTSSNTFSVTLTNTSSSTVNLSTATSDLSLSGTAASGLTVSGVSPSSVTLNNNGDTALVTYTLSGTPSSGGTLIANWFKNGLICQRTTTIAVPTPTGSATFTLPQKEPVFSIIDTNTSTDIQGVVDNNTNKIIINVPYTAGSGDYAAYTSTGLTLTGQGGDTNTLTISYPAGTFSTTGNIPVTVEVSGADTSFAVTKQLRCVYFLLNFGQLAMVFAKIYTSAKSVRARGINCKFLKF